MEIVPSCVAETSDPARSHYYTTVGTMRVQQQSKTENSPSDPHLLLYFTLTQLVLTRFKFPFHKPRLYCKKNNKMVVSFCTNARFNRAAGETDYTITHTENVD